MKNILILIVAFLLGGCMTSDRNIYNDRVNDFLNKLEQVPPTSTVNNPEQKFLSLFGDFKKGTTEQVIQQLYADTFYFNDTFKTFNDIDALSAYLKETADLVELTTVEILDVSQSDTDYYLRWVMHMKFKAKGREVNSRSIGMTQIRFNDEGKVILHQDYWDGAEGFYQHLPIIGYIIRKIRTGL